MSTQVNQVGMVTNMWDSMINCVDQMSPFEEMICGLILTTAMSSSCKDEKFSELDVSWVLAYGSSIPHSVKGMLNPDNGLRWAYTYADLVSRVGFNADSFWGAF